MYNDINLLEFDSRNPSKYVTRLMQALFTFEEHRTSIIMTDRSKNNGNKRKLDNDRVNLLKRKLLYYYF